MTAPFEFQINGMAHIHQEVSHIRLSAFGDPEESGAFEEDGEG
jgi:hypothetical protein